MKTAKLSTIPFITISSANRHLSNSFLTTKKIKSLLLVAVFMSVSMLTRSQTIQLTNFVTDDFKDSSNSFQIRDTTNYVYNGTGLNFDTSYSYQWSPSNQIWVYKNRAVQVLNSLGQVQAAYYDTWDLSLATWTKTNKIEFTFNAVNGKIALQKFFIFDSNNNLWNEEQHTVYTYDVNDDLISKYNEKLYRSAWSIYQQTVFRYDITHKLLEEVEVMANANNINRLDSIYKFEYNYSLAKPRQVRSRYLYANTNRVWQPEIALIDTFLYNSIDSVESVISLKASGNLFANSTRINYTYYPSNSMIETKETQTWNDSLQAWYHSEVDPNSFGNTRLRYYYRTITPSSISNTNSENGVSIYPQPANDFIEVNGFKMPIKLQLLDLNGRILKTANINRIQTQEIPNGIYLLKITQGQKTSFKKALIQH